MEKTDLKSQKIKKILKNQGGRGLEEKCRIRLNMSCGNDNIINNV